MVNKGSFTLSGGSITGNATSDATYGYGGGVCLYGTFNLSGDAIIQNNKKAGATDNLYLGWNTINITGPLGENARIGVTAEGVPRSFISGWSDNMAGEDPADYFSSDGDALGIGLNADGNVVLGSLCTTITLNPNGGTLPEYSLVEGAALPIPTKTGYTFAGWYENPEFSGTPVTDIPTDSTENLNFYAHWQNIPVTDVKLDKTSLTMQETDSDTLTATVLPDNATNKAVTWSSNDSTVATVDESGKVTAVAPGTATITVTTEDGSKTATCTVIVHTATTITTQPQSVSVTEGQSATFSVAATGDNLRYQWQINSGNGWSAITGATDASYTIDRTTTAMSGNQYRCIVTGDGGETTSSAATLTVRSYEPPYTGKYSYEVVSDVGENGTIDVDRYATEGDQVTITISPDEAYLLDDLTVTSGGRYVALTDNGDGTYTFTMPSGDVAITATFAEDPNWTNPEDPSTDVSEIFTDVPANHWAKAAIQYVYDNGLMTGVSDTAFAPEATTTRAMIVSMLARMENVTSAADAGFNDVAANDWYATAVNWAAASGITSGTGDGNFSPNTAITREQLAAILMNYAQYKGQDVSARATLDTYNDATAISSWANDVMSWAVAEGLLTGVTNDQLQPQENATRAQVAAILQRFLAQ